MTSTSNPGSRDQGSTPPSRSLIKADKSNKLAGAKEALKQKLLKAVMSQAIDELGSPDDIATTVLEQIKDAEHQLLLDAQTALREQVVRRIADQTLQTLEDSAATASEALTHVASDNASLEQAEADLKAILVKQIAQRSVDRIKESETLEAARQEVDDQHANVLGAIDAVRTTLISSIAERATGQLSEVDAVVEEAQAHIDFEAEDLRQAIGALRDVILVTIAERATDMLSDSDTVAQEAREQVNNDHELIIAASGVLRELMLEDIASRTSEGLQDVGALARQAKSRVDHESKTLLDSIVQLRDMLLEEVANRSISSLADVDESARRARTNMGDAPEEIQQASSRLEDMLIDEIAERSASTIKDAATVASLAMDRINVEAPEIEEAQQIVHERMLSAIMNDAIDEINDAMADGPEAAVSFLDDAPPVSRTEPKATPVSFGEAETAEPQARKSDFDLPPPPSLGFSFSSTPEPPAPPTDEFDQPSSSDLETPSQTDDEFVSDESDEALHAYEGDGAVEESAFSTNDTDDATEEIAFDQAHTEDVFASESLGGTPSVFEIDDSGDFFDEPEAAGSTADLGQTASSEAPSVADGSDDTFGAEDDDQSWMALGTESEDIEVAVPSDPVEETPEADAWNFSSFEPMQFDPDEESEVEALTTEEAPAQPLATPPVFNPSLPAVHSRELYYVYGIVATASVAAFEEAAFEGIDPDYNIEYLEHDELTAIVSKVDSSVYGTAALNEHLKDGGWVRENVRAHAQILEQFRAQTTLVPLRFGTVHADADEVIDDLDVSYSTYLGLLANLKGKQEWGLRIYRNLITLTSHLSQSDEQVQESLTAISKGVARFVKEEMNALAEGDEQENADLLTAHCVKRSHDLLSAFSEKAVFKALVPGENDGKGEMIANVAYLVSEEHDQATQKAIESLRKQYQTLGFTFEMTGPWPPYHFVESEDVDKD